MAEKTKDLRARNWSTIVYPESVPPEWQQILKDQCVPTFISPLHDMDTNEQGEIKKAHHHVIFMFDGKKSLEQMVSLVQLFGGTQPMKVHSLPAYARYLCHLDETDKVKYDPEQVVALGGADYFAAIQKKTDKYKAIDEMTAFCDENEILSFRELLNYSKVNRRDWFRVLCDSGSMLMIRFLKAKTWEKESHYVSATSPGGSIDGDPPQE